PGRPIRYQPIGPQVGHYARDQTRRTSRVVPNRRGHSATAGRTGGEVDLDADRAAVFGSGETHHASPTSWSQRVRSALSHARALSRPVALARLSFTRSSPHTDPVARLIRAHRSIHPGADTAALRRGYEIAERMHRGQMRKSGDPYITHPRAVAVFLADLGMDTTPLVAALLHDTVEDTSYNLPTLRRDFGPEVAHLVDGVTKFDKVFFGAQAEAETIRKLI